MRAQDEAIFSDAARDLELWILVRGTNPHSLKYIGMPGYRPKGITCKAKTANYDVDGYKLAGLVTSPFIHPKAFPTHKIFDVRMQWNKTASPIGGIYQIDSRPSSRHYGCLMTGGHYIHGDYDLYDIVDPQQPFRNLALVEILDGIPHRKGANTQKVMDYVNPRIGSPMIQHSGNAQFADHTNQGNIDTFGPDGEKFTILNEFSLKKIYEDMFKGRKTH